MACIITVNGREVESTLSKRLIEEYGDKHGMSYYNNFVKPYQDAVSTPGVKNLVDREYSLYNFLQGVEAADLYNGQLEPRFEQIKSYIDFLKEAQKDARAMILPNVQAGILTMDSYETAAIMDGFSVNFFEKLFAEGLSAFDVTRGKVIKTALAAFEDTQAEMKTKVIELRGETDKLEKKFGESHAKTILSYNKEDRLYDMTLAMKVSPTHFYDYFLNVHLKELGMELDVDAITDDVGIKEEEIDTGSDTTGIDTAFNRDAFKSDPKNNTPRSVKRLLYGLPELDKKGKQIYNIELGTKKMKPFGQVFAKLADTLASVSPNPMEFIRVIQNLKDPVLNHLITRLRVDDADIKNFDSFKYSKNKKAFESTLLKFNLLAAFTQQFSKHKYDFQSLVMELNGDMYFSNNNQEKLASTIKTEWQNNFTEKLATNYFNKTDGYKHKALALDLKAAFGNNRPKRFLELLGINLTDQNVFKANLSDKNGKFTTIKQLVGDIHLSFIAEDVYTSSSEKLFDIFNFAYNSVAPIPLRKLLDVETKSNNGIRNLGHLNEENNLIYDINLNTFLTTFANELNTVSGSVKELADKYPLLFGTKVSEYVENSVWRKAVINGSNIHVGVFGGVNIPDNAVSGVVTKDLTSADFYVQKMLGAFEGKFSFVRAADRGTENYFQVDGQKAVNGKVIRERLKGYLQDEINAVYQLVRNGKGQELVHYNKNGIYFRAFSELNKANPEEQLKFLEEEVFPLVESGALKDDDINGHKIGDSSILQIVNNNMNIVIESELDLALELGFLKKSKNGKLRPGALAVPTSVLNLPLVKDKASSPSERIKIAVELTGLNNYVANIEQTKLFVGDPAQFKNIDEFFKRMSMMNSTKEISLVDARTNKALMNTEYLLEERAGYKYAEDSQVTEGHMRTITIQDEQDIVSEETRDMLSSIFKPALEEEFKGTKNAAQKVKNKLEAYMEVYGFKKANGEKVGGMEVADAIAYITLDEYKRLRIRGAQWSPEHERTYNRLANNEAVSPSDIKALSILKYQYNGPINTKNGDIHTIGGRKFEFVPLIPQILPKGSNLEKLNNQLLASGTGVAFMKTAAKFGHNDNTHSFYDENGNFNIDLVKQPVFDLLDYRYMGDQLKIADKEKQEVSQSTQFRKLIFVNFFRNGEIQAEDPDLKSDLERLAVVQAELITESYTELGKELGFDIADAEGLGVNDENIKLIVDGIKKRFFEKGMSANMVNALTKITDLGLIDTIPGKQKIEHTIMTIFRKSVMNSKRAGEAMAQVSSQGFEVGEKSDVLKWYEQVKAPKTFKPSKAVLDAYTASSELKEIGTAEEYAGYLKTVFPNSEVQDVVYHGTTTRFDEFREDKAGSNTENADAYKGIFFSKNKAVADIFIDSFKKENTEGEIMAVILDVDNLTTASETMAEFYFGSDRKNQIIKNTVDFGGDGILFTVPKGSKLTIPKEGDRTFEGGKGNTIIDSKNFIPGDAVISIEGKGKKKKTKVENAYKSTKEVSEYVVFSPKQTLILGSPNDKEGFDNFIQKGKNVKEGNLLPMQIMIPLPKKLLQYVIDKYSDGKVLSQGALDSFNEDVAKDETRYRESGEETTLTLIRRITGFRIPFQAPSSGEVAQVSKYLNPQFATGIVVPKEMVAKTGSDFDIDKLNLYYNLFNIKNGEIVLDEAPMSALLNEMNMLEQNITLHKENARQLLAPLTTVAINEITQYIRNQRGTVKEKNNPTKISTLFRNDTQLEKANSFLSGKNGVGQVAVHVTNHPIAQQANLKINIGFDMRFDDVENGTVDSELITDILPDGKTVAYKYLPLGNTTDIDGNLISETLSELLTAYVDIAKDAYIFDINAITEVANSMLLMLRTGVSPLDVFKLINQPIIRDYFEARKTAQSFVSKVHRTSMFPISRALVEKTIKGKYLARIPDGKGQERTLLKEYYKDNSINKALPDSSLVIGLTDTISNKEDAFFQLTALDKFLAISSKATRFQGVIRATSADTKYFKDYEQANYQLNEIHNVSNANEQDSLFANLGKMFTANPIVAETTKAKFDYIKAFMNELSIAYNGNFGPELEQIKAMATDFIFDINKAQRIRQEVDYAFVSYLYGSELNGKDKVEYKEIYGTLIAPDNIEDSLAFKLKNYKGRLREYIIPALARPEKGIKENKIKLRTRDIDVTVSNIIEDEMLRIRDSSKELYDSIFKVALVQSPMRLGSFNLLRFIPHADYTAMARTVLEKVKSKEGGLAVSMSDFRQQFFLANPELIWDSFGNARTQIQIEGSDLGTTAKVDLKGRGLKIGVTPLKITEDVSNKETKEEIIEFKSGQQILEQVEEIFGNLGIIGIIRDSTTGNFYYVDGVTNKLVAANGKGTNYKLYGSVTSLVENAINQKVVNTFKEKVKIKEKDC